MEWDWGTAALAALILITFAEVIALRKRLDAIAAQLERIQYDLSEQRSDIGFLQRDADVLQQSMNKAWGYPEKHTSERE